MTAKYLPMREIMAQGAVMPILTVGDAGAAGEIAKALVAGGIKVFEITLRTPAALKGLEAMRVAAPEAIIGAGTILNAHDLQRAMGAGAAFGVSPGLTQELAKAVRQADFPFIPGVESTSEAMYAREMGFKELKLFPANVIGGVQWLAAIRPVFPDLVFCATGGIKPADVPAHLAQPNCWQVGGSWVTPADLIAKGDWKGIEALARQAAGFKRPA
jgi:2-dehydro-3-deoxyphosphogluconate aldolase / (4S)-4-hydroxy-2-oxoglutarate aldolase